MIPPPATLRQRERMRNNVTSFLTRALQHGAGMYERCGRFSLKKLSFGVFIGGFVVTAVLCLSYFIVNIYEWFDCDIRK